MRALLLALVVLVVAVAAAPAAPNGFPIVLAKGPDPGTTTPDGADALAEVAQGGATVLKIGPATVPWTHSDIDDANAQNRAAAANSLSTWVNLSTVSRATPGSSSDALLENVVTSLTGDAGATAIGFWKGADEPQWSGIAPSELQFAYCRGTGRGEPGWCAGEPVLDTAHEWTTIEAPRGTADQLAPYSAVTDAHGVDVYPVTLSTTSPNLHQVGTWTSTIASITPSQDVWTTLQVCASGSYSKTTGEYVLPTFAQERYMAYDAIVNGARSLAFYGGNIAGCWNATDRQFGWNWTFWSSVLKPLLAELNASSPLAPALADPAAKTLTTSDSTTQAVSRGGDTWVIATRSGTGSADVTISGLPSSVTSASVYTENRTIPVSNGSFTDTFAQWRVHVYRLGSFSPVGPAQPTAAVAPTTHVANKTQAGTSGDDRLTGTSGDDLIWGLAGDDTIDGGPGRDVIYGGPGNDTIDARDGERDVVDCGPGTDTASVDAIDRVSGCEAQSP